MPNKWRCKICGRKKQDESETSFCYYFKESEKRVEPICKNCYDKLKKSEKEVKK